MVFARNALASGPGNAWNSIHLPPTWRKVKGASKFAFVILLHFCNSLSCEKASLLFHRRGNRKSAREPPLLNYSRHCATVRENFDFRREPSIRSRSRVKTEE